MTASLKEPASIWKGSAYTASATAHEIYKRRGKQAAKQHDPSVNCFTYLGWRQRGYQVRHGEKAIRSITFIPVDKIGEDGKVKTESVPKNVYLFYIAQVDKK